MKYVQLTQGKEAIVDDEMFNYINQWNWCYKQGYAGRGTEIKYKQKTIFMHRVINNTPEGFETDHINENKLDNRKCNLRTVTSQQNKFNIKLKKNNKSGYKGICWDKGVSKWRAYIAIDYKSKYLGIFEKIEDAILARKLFEEGMKL